MPRLNLLEISEQIVQLKEASNETNETTTGFYYKGALNESTEELLNNIKRTIITYSLNVFTLNIDSVQIEWEDFSVTQHDREWELSLSEKKALLESANVVSEDIEGFIFFDQDYFMNVWLDQVSGINSLSMNGDLHSKKPHKIFVYGLENSLGGPRIAIIPLSNWNDEPNEAWLKSTKLPDKTKIQQTVHFITSDMDGFLPENFLIKWGDVDCELAKKFHFAAIKALMCTLVQEYYSDEKVVINGKKRIEVQISDHCYSLDNITKENVDIVEGIVEWCYAENDEITRILLIIDRISLDFDQDSKLISIVPVILEKAFNQAKARYKYVVLDKKTEYTKELVELQKDTSVISEKYMESAQNYISSFLKDLLAFAFILTVGVVAKKIAYGNLLFTEEADLLFKAFAIYLLFSLFFRLWFTISSSIQFNSFMLKWKDVVREYMSDKELKEYVSSSLKGMKINFGIIIFIVSMIYIVMSILSWNSNSVLGYFLESNNTNELRNIIYDKNDTEDKNGSIKLEYKGSGEPYTHL